MSTGPQTVAADRLHAMKYRSEGESFREAMNRVASALKDTDAHFHALREMLIDQRFVPAGRIQAAAGSAKAVTHFNCAASLPILDSFVDDEGCIMDRAKEAARTMRMGCGIGYDFSTLRPRGDIIAKLQSHASGPVSFMQIFNAVCLATSSSGHRRGAQMASLRCDHPSIEEFIKAKQNTDQLTGFNISVAVTDEFMDAALNDKPFTLRFNGRDYATISAAALWESIMRSTWDWGEPGVIFIDRVNAMNNLWYCEDINTTNPCSEVPLPPGGMCNLGSLNLVKYLSADEQGQLSINWTQIADDIPHAVRALDNVTDRSIYPLEAQRLEAQSKRRIGIGVMGLANALEALGYAYGRTDFLESESAIMGWIRDHIYEASIALAREKGAFPLFHRGHFSESRFVATLPPDLRHDISVYGVRTSHGLAIAPTGTISQCCDNVSSGIEPVWAHELQRPINTPLGVEIATIEDYGVARFGVRGRLACDVSPIEHVDVLTTAQAYVDSAISKTINVGVDTPWDAFKDVYRQAWENGAKSCATFTSGGKRAGLLAPAPTSEGAACRIDPTTGERSCE